MTAIISPARYRSYRRGIRAKPDSQPRVLVTASCNADCRCRLTVLWRMTTGKNSIVDTPETPHSIMAMAALEMIVLKSSSLVTDHYVGL